MNVMRGTSIPLYLLIPSALLLGVGVFWMDDGGMTAGSPRATRPDPPLAASRAPEDQPEHPLPASPVHALPPLARSDAAVREAIRKARGGETLAALLSEDDLLLGFVAAVERLPRIESLDPDVLEHYAAVAEALDRLDVNGALSVYWRLYPLLQQAYEEVAPAGGYFNDRVVGVIDKLLQRCVEACSAGQKILQRMDAAEGDRITTKLQQVRKRLALRPPAA
jgi:DUF3014 family protein